MRSRNEDIERRMARIAGGLLVALLGLAMPAGKALASGGVLEEEADAYEPIEGAEEPQPSQPDPTKSGVKELSAIDTGAEPEHDCSRYIQIRYNTVYFDVWHTVTGSRLVNQCYSEPMGYHWYECSLCHRKYGGANISQGQANARNWANDQTAKMAAGDYSGVNAHNIVRQGYGVSGSNYVTELNQCVWSAASQQWSCPDCGWSATWKKPALPQTAERMYQRGWISQSARDQAMGSWQTEPYQMYHYHRCTDCGSVDNSCPTCTGSNLCYGGTCTVCGYKYPNPHHRGNSGATFTQNGEVKAGVVKCLVCGKALLAFDQLTYTYIGNNKYKATIRITSWDQASYGSKNDVYNKLAICSDNGSTPFPVVTYTRKVKDPYIYFEATCDFSKYINQANQHVSSSMSWVVVPEWAARVKVNSIHTGIESEPPTFISTPTVRYENRNVANGFSPKCYVDVSLKDNWGYDSNFVNVRILSADRKTTAANWMRCKMTGTGASRVYSCTLTAVTEIQGYGTYIVQAQDACGNLSERAITIGYLDAVPPQPSQAVYETSKAWSTSKSITVRCTDNGAGDVRIAFNDTGDAQVGYNSGGVTRSGNTYSRIFTFFGNVYGSVEGTIYFKDDAGNESSARLVVWNLDNTAPTVDGVSVTDAFNSAGEPYGWTLHVGGSDTWNGARGPVGAVLRDNDRRLRPAAEGVPALGRAHGQEVRDVLRLGHGPGRQPLGALRARGDTLRRQLQRQGGGVAGVQRPGRWAGVLQLRRERRRGHHRRREVSAKALRAQWPPGKSSWRPFCMGNHERHAMQVSTTTALRGIIYMEPGGRGKQPTPCAIITTGA